MAEGGEEFSLISNWPICGDKVQHRTETEKEGMEKRDALRNPTPYQLQILGPERRTTLKRRTHFEIRIYFYDNISIRWDGRKVEFNQSATVLDAGLEEWGWFGMWFN